MIPFCSFCSCTLSILASVWRWKTTLWASIKIWPNSVAQTIKQSCLLFCLKSTYKKAGQDELHHTQEDQSEHINNLMTVIHYMMIYCTQIWCSLLTHVNVIMSWFWKGRHFRNTSDEAMCPVKLGFISSCWNASMNHFDRSTLVYHSWLTMEDKQMKRMRVYNDFF